MANSLITGVSGLTTHQKMIEVVGHNLANLNTTGFKARRAHFSDIFYETVKGGAGGALGETGGSNPAQIGNGSKLATIGVNFTQGNLEATGAEFDFAIDGEGFFVLDSGQGELFSRAGVFHVDQNGFLVDSATGYHVQRTGNIGEATGTEPGFQTSGDDSIQIPLGAIVPGQATTSANLVGNLSPSAGAATSQMLLTTGGLTTAAAPATSLTLLNDLDNVTTPFQTGDVINIQGTDHNGTAINSQLAVDGTTTVNDLITAIDTQFADASASLSASGQLELTANDTGSSMLSLNLTSEQANVGQIDLTDQQFVVDQLGQDGESVRGGLEVFDERGDGHLIGVSFERMPDDTWTMTADIDPSAGTLSDATVEGITFRPNGSIDIVNGPDSQIAIQFAGQSDPQIIDFGFGDAGSLSGLTSISGDSNLASTQDGYSTGTLVAISVDGSGLIEGIGSNGRRFEVAQVALATFRNPNGLSAEGNNFFAQTISSGDANVGSPASGGRGRINTGQLEASNVDIAVEFTRLIVAQRGFSANARTITVTDEILEELNSLIR